MTIDVKVSTRIGQDRHEGRDTDWVWELVVNQSSGRIRLMICKGQLVGLLWWVPG